MSVLRNFGQVWAASGMPMGKSVNDNALFTSDISSFSKKTQLNNTGMSVEQDWIWTSHKNHLKTARKSRNLSFFELNSMEIRISTNHHSCLNTTWRLKQCFNDNIPDKCIKKLRRITKSTWKRKKNVYIFLSISSTFSFLYYVTCVSLSFPYNFTYFYYW